jgi:anthranilate synthase component II
MILLIDNYDSFTYNLYHYLLEIGAEVEVVRNDVISVDEIAKKKLEGIVISPGPCTPNEAGICLELVTRLQGKVPMFGVCLGHQSIAQSFGAEIIRGDKPMHAKISMIHHENTRLFSDIPKSFKATRYHSLIVKRDTLPDCFSVTAVSDDGVIQAIEHKHLPLFGVQFHPESIASEYGHELLSNFLNICKGLGQ